MKENGIAKILQIIGWVEMGCALILSLFFDVDEIFGIYPGLVINFSAFIVCMLFQGFAEIIELLHKGVQKQDAILDFLKGTPNGSNNAPKTIVEDIESNLPNI